MQCAGGRYEVQLISEFEREGEGYVTIGLTLPRSVLIAWAKHELLLMVEGYGAGHVEAWHPTPREALETVGNLIALDLHPPISESPDAASGPMITMSNSLFEKGPS
jgi:hypothetical protein